MRYVVVARSPSGSATAIYEGLRCATGEVKTYARQTSGSPWSMVKTPQWQALSAPLPSKHALVLARQGACDSPANSVADMVSSLKK